jgi:hypothetical protein
MSEQRVIDVVPGTPQENGNCCDSRVDADYIGEEDGKIRTDDRSGQAKADITEPINDFLSPG